VLNCIRLVDGKSTS